MEYQLVFSPGLDMSPGDFVHAWNNETTTQTLAQARLAPASNKAYSDPLLDVVWLTISTVGLGMATNALYDLMKNILTKKRSKKHVKVTQLDQPDGTHLLIFEEEE